MSKKQNVLVGKIVNAHGVKGWVKVRYYTDTPKELAAYSPLVDGDGQEFVVHYQGRQNNNIVLVSIDGVEDRDRALALKGTELFVERNKLPDNKQNDFYVQDLKGLQVRGLSGNVVGEVYDVVNYGAGDVLVIRGQKAENERQGKDGMLSFNDAAVPEINLDKGYIVIDEDHLL